MTDKVNERIREFKKIDKELNDLYHGLALKIGISDSAFTILYVICELGDGCLQRDICYEAFASKQTVNSSIRKLEQDGYLYLEDGHGRDKHIHLTDQGQTFVENSIYPIIQIENEVLLNFSDQEQSAMLRLSRQYIQGLRNRFSRL